jgi:sulfatase maturation enzyme AslB (radical SAM superfamily)
MAFHCNHLDTGLVFAHLISPCCPGTRYHPPSLKYNGGEFPYEVVRQSRLEAVIQNQSGTPACGDCPHLLRGKPINLGPQFATKFKNVTFDHFMNCNCRCSYCDAWKNESPSPLYHLLDTITQMHLHGDFYPNTLFSWGGGEPTILDEFEEMFKYLSNLGYHQLVNTNALVFSQAIFDGLKTCKVEVQVSPDAGTPETYLRVKGLDKFDTVVCNLRRYSETRQGQGLVIKYIAGNDNVDDLDLDEFSALCQILRPNRIVISPEANQSWADEITSRTIYQTRKLLIMCKAVCSNVSIISSLYGLKYSSQILA